MSAVLAIDQGTSATKAVVVDDHGRLLAEVDQPFEGATYAGDGVEQDPAPLLASVVAAGRSALAVAGVPVGAIGLGNQGETVIVWDRRTGEALSSAISWQDRRSRIVTTRLADEQAARVDRVAQLTGLPLDPYFAAPKMTMLAASVVDLMRTRPDAVITTIDAWVTHQLTGAFVTDAATASRTMLLDPQRLDWDAEACALFDVDASRLPRVVACDEQVGLTSAFGGMVPVTGLIVDQQAALLAQDCRSPGMAKCTYGTGAFLLSNVGGEHRLSTTGLATSLAWVLRDGTRASCVDGQVYSVGAAITWLQRIGLIDEPSDLDRLGLAVPDSGGVSIMPTLAGMGAPVWRPDARGSFTGMTLSTTREHLVRAFGEGIAAQVALLVDAVSREAGARPAALRVDGGVTRSRLVMQAQADLIDAPVEVYPHGCATALGIAALALRGLAGPGAEESVVTGWQPVAVYEPSTDRGAAESIMARARAAVAAHAGGAGIASAAGAPSDAPSSTGASRSTDG